MKLRRLDPYIEAKAIELSKIFKTQKDEGSSDVSLEDINNKLAGIKKKIVLSPAKADIGLLNGAKFFLVNDEILMSKNGIFYLPSRKTLEVIIEKYVPIDKVENSTLNNLRNIIETLYINKL